MPGQSARNKTTPAKTLQGTYGLDHSTQVSKILVHGHSYASGDGSLAGGSANRYATRLASWLHATETNIAVAGSRLTSGGATGGGVNTLLQNYAPARSAGPYVSSLQAAFMNHGINDATYMSAAQFALTIPETLGAAIDRYRAGAVFEDNHASVTVASGTWNSFTSTTGSGTTWRYTAGNGSLNIAVPSGYAGQAISIGLTAPANTSFTTTVSKGGTTLATYDTAAKVASVALNLDICVRVRIPAGTLPAGAQTLVVAISNVSGPNAIFDYWSIEATVPPPVFLVLANRLGSTGYTNLNPGSANSPLTDADITRINAVFQAVANSYSDGRVVTVATDDLFPGATNLSTADGVHPNLVGHGLMAGRLRQAMRDYFAANAADLPYLGIA